MWQSSGRMLVARDFYEFVLIHSSPLWILPFTFCNHYCIPGQTRAPCLRFLSSC